MTFCSFPLVFNHLAATSLNPTPVNTPHTPYKQSPESSSLAFLTHDLHHGCYFQFLSDLFPKGNENHVFSQKVTMHMVQKHQQDH